MKQVQWRFCPDAGHLSSIAGVDDNKISAAPYSRNWPRPMMLIATFPSTQAALQAERALEGVVLIELIPVPRKIHSNCGFCLLVGPIEPDEGTFDSSIFALQSKGAQSLWRVIELVSQTSKHKEKRYEPYP